MYYYIGSIVYTVFLFIPFAYLCDFLFNILQIPFALIHRYAARLVYLYKTYIVCQFFSLLASVYVPKFNLSPIILLILYSIILFIIHSSAYSDVLNNDYQNGTHNAPFCAIVAFLSIPTLWIIYFLNIRTLNQPAMWFFKAIYFLYDVPIIGSVLKFISRAISGGAILFFIIFLIIALITIVVKISSCIAAPRQQLSENSEEKQNIVSSTKTWQCKKCHNINPTENSYCQKCETFRFDESDIEIIPNNISNTN